jgi:hypothetical protein
MAALIETARRRTMDTGRSREDAVVADDFPRGRRIAEDIGEGTNATILTTKGLARLGSDCSWDFIKMQTPSLVGCCMKTLHIGA